MRSITNHNVVLERIKTIIEIQVQIEHHTCKNHKPADTKSCNVTIPIKTLSSLTTGKNCTGEGGDSIFCIASTAIVSEPIVLGFLKDHTSHVNADPSDGWITKFCKTRN